MEKWNVTGILMSLVSFGLFIWVIKTCIGIFREERKNRKTPWARAHEMYAKRYREWLERTRIRKQQEKLRRYYCPQCSKKVKWDTTACPKCGVIFGGIQCTSCGYRGKLENFLEGECPECKHAFEMAHF